MMRMQSRSTYGALDIDPMYGHIPDAYESGDTTSSDRSRYTNGSGSLYGQKMLRQQHLQEDINNTFDFMTPLGNSGRSSSVWKARHRTSKKLFALKGIEMDRAPIRQQSSFSVTSSSNSSTTAYYSDPVEQFQFLSKLDHPNIVKYYEYHLYSAYCYISKEYCSGGNLLEVRTFPHAESNAQTYIKQLLSAIHYLHGRSIVHRNLKAQNLMLSEPLKGELKLVDFEFCTKVDDNATYRDCPGNIHYAAPEIVRPRKGSELKKSDMWAVGVITYYLICGYFPFRGKSKKDVLAKIRASISAPIRYPPGVHLSDTCKDFIEKLLTYNPKERLSARDALQHDWIGEFVPSPVHSPEPTPPLIDPLSISAVSPSPTPRVADPLSPVSQPGPPSPPLSPSPVTPPPADPPLFPPVDLPRDVPASFKPSPAALAAAFQMESPSPQPPSPPDSPPLKSHHRPATMILVNGGSPPPPTHRSPDSVVTNSISFAMLNSMDGKLIDNLLDEVEEDEQKQAAAIGPVTLFRQRSMSRSKSRSTVSLASKSSKRTGSLSRSKRPLKRIKPITSNKRGPNESTLDFDVLSINGDMIDSILDEVDEKERLISAHQAMQKGPADLDTLAAASNAADEAIRSMNAMLNMFRQTAGPAVSPPPQ